MIDLFHIDKMAPLDISWEQKNVERDLSTSLNIQRTFTDFARTSPTWPPKLSTALKKLGWSNIGRRYFPFPCNVFLCGSGRCSKSDFPSNWVRQRAQRTLHGQFPGPGPRAQTFLLHQITQVTNQANYAFSNFVTHSWELWPYFTIFWNKQIYIWTWYIMISNSFAHQ